MTTPSSSTRERGRHNALLRYRPADDPEVIEARRALKAARAADYVRELVENAPPLSLEQRARLAVLLLPSDGEAA